MSILDRIAQGTGSSLSSLLSGYKTGLADMREKKIHEQTSTLRDLQIQQAQREAGTWEEDRELEMRQKKAAVEAAETQAQWAQEDRPGAVKRQRIQDQMAEKQLQQFDVVADRETKKFQAWETNQERADHLHQVEETERHVTAAIQSGNFAGYITENADAIKEVGDDGTDKMVDRIASGEATPAEIKQIQNTLEALGPKRQKLVTDLKLLDYEYGKKKEVAAAAVKPGTPDQATTTTYKKIEQEVASWDVFEGLEGKKNDEGEYSEAKAEALSAVQDNAEGFRQISRINKTPFNQAEVMQVMKELVNEHTIMEGGEKGESGIFADQDKFNVDSFNMDMSKLIKFQQANPTAPLSVGYQLLQASKK